MIFAKRDLKDDVGRSLSQRFAHHIGRLLTTSDDDLNQIQAINIPLCYTLIDETPKPNTEALDLLKQTLQKITQKYHHKTGHWLDQEQIAFAIAWQDAKHQATTLKERYSSKDIPNTALNNTSPFRSALLAEALQIKQFFSEATISKEPAQPCVFKRALNLPIDEMSMSDIETIGREVRVDCEKVLTKNGISLDNIEACWRLKLHYEGCNQTLTLKCMPVEMLRDVFVAQYRQQYGNADENRSIVIHELEIELRATSIDPSSKAKASIYLEQWMSQWQQTDNCQNGVWLKQDNPFIQDKFSWLQCSILEEMLEKLVTKAADSSIPEFFMKNSQKGVDEVVMRN